MWCRGCIYGEKIDKIIVFIFLGGAFAPPTINAASPLVAIVTCAQAAALIVLTPNRHARGHHSCPFHPSPLFLWPRGGRTSQQWRLLPQLRNTVDHTLTAYSRVGCSKQWLCLSKFRDLAYKPTNKGKSTFRYIRSDQINTTITAATGSNIVTNIAHLIFVHQSCAMNMNPL